MAKKAKAVKSDKKDSYEIVKEWTENHACDRYTIAKVGEDKFRVNMYIEGGDTIRTSRLSRSFFLSVIDGVVKDQTIRKNT
jgi:hypothetical protein